MPGGRLEKDIHRHYGSDKYSRGRLRFPYQACDGIVVYGFLIRLVMELAGGIKLWQFLSAHVIDSKPRWALCCVWRSRLRFH